MNAQAKQLRRVLERMRELPSFVGIDLDGPNVRGNFGETPLHVAVVQGDVAAIKTLLAAGADINAKGEHGYTALHEAVEQGKIDIVKLLLALGSSIAATNDDGLSTLELARVTGREDIVAELQDKLA
jgi:ankyrin repeat protein